MAKRSQNVSINYSLQHEAPRNIHGWGYMKYIRIDLEMRSAGQKDRGFEDE